MCMAWYSMPRHPTHTPTTTTTIAQDLQWTIECLIYESAILYEQFIKMLTIHFNTCIQASTYSNTFLIKYIIFFFCLPLLISASSSIQFQPIAYWNIWNSFDSFFFSFCKCLGCLLGWNHLVFDCKQFLHFRQHTECHWMPLHHFISNSKIA